MPEYRPTPDGVYCGFPETPRSSRRTPLDELRLYYRIKAIRKRLEDPSAFNIVRKGFARKYRAKHHDKALVRDRVGRQKLRDRHCKRVLEYLLMHPCVSCGEPDPCCLDFDHLYGKTGKLSAISQMRSVSDEKFSQEVKKCQILCANCHRKKTAKDLGWFKAGWRDYVKAA